MVSEYRAPLPLPVWERADEIMRLDPLRFRMLHKKVYAHKQRVLATRGTYDARGTEKEVAGLHAYADNMRRTRLQNHEEASLDLKRENSRLVERLCSVMRESEARQKQIMSPRPPANVPPSQGTLNTSSRRKAAQQIDKDNKAMLDRLMKAGPTVATVEQLAPWNQAQRQLASRITRIRRKDLLNLTAPPPPDRQPRVASLPPWRKARLAPLNRPHSADAAAGDDDELTRIDTSDECAAEVCLAVTAALRNPPPARRVPDCERLNNLAQPRVVATAEPAAALRSPPPHRPVATAEPARSSRGEREKKTPLAPVGSSTPRCNAASATAGSSASKCNVAASSSGGSNTNTPAAASSSTAPTPKRPRGGKSAATSVSAEATGKATAVTSESLASVSAAALVDNDALREYSPLPAASEEPPATAAVEVVTTPAQEEEAELTADAENWEADADGTVEVDCCSHVDEPPEAETAAIANDVETVVKSVIGSSNSPTTTASSALCQSDGAVTQGTQSTVSIIGSQSTQPPPEVDVTDAGAAGAGCSDDEEFEESSHYSPAAARPSGFNQDALGQTHGSETNCAEEAAAWEEDSHVFEEDDDAAHEQAAAPVTDNGARDADDQEYEEDYSDDNYDGEEEQFDSDSGSDS